jgi:hypothetical protein
MISNEFSQILKDLPNSYYKALLEDYIDALKYHNSNSWRQSGQAVGRLTETAYSIILGKLKGSYEEKPSKPTNFPVACSQLSQIAGDHDRALRIQIPRVLAAVYEFRNNRDLGHIGGDVDASRMDAEWLMQSARWILAEIVRVFSGVDSDSAKDLIDKITTRDHPAIWKDGEIRRVLNPELNMTENTLLLLYAESTAVPIKTLAQWAEYKNFTVYRDNIIMKLHKERQIYFDKTNGTARILQPGILRVEQQDLLTLKLDFTKPQTKKKRASTRKSTLSRKNKRTKR